MLCVEGKKRQDRGLRNARGQIQGHLGRFDFSGDEVQRRAGSLSGGERARVALALMMLADANLLLDDARTQVPLVDGTTVTAWDILATDAYLQRRETAHAAATEAMLIQERRIEIHRNLLIEASRRRQALEKLKLRRKAAHRAEMERVDLAQLNEIALLLHDRRVRGEQLRDAG